MMEDTTQRVLDGGDVPVLQRYLEQLQIAQQDAERPDWWQPFIDDVQATLVQRQN